MHARESTDPGWWDETNNRAMLICRISDKKQLQGVSLDAQKHELTEYSERVSLRVAAVEAFQESAKKSQLRACTSGASAWSASESAASPTGSSLRGTLRLYLHRDADRQAPPERVLRGHPEPASGPGEAGGGLPKSVRVARRLVRRQA